MRTRTITRVALWLCAFLPVAQSSAATQPPKANASPKSQVQQTSRGCGSPNIHDNSGQIGIGVTCQYITVMGRGTHMNSLEINQERLLLAKNPTELRITDAYLRAWLPDDRRISLTLEFENPRDIPIPEIEVDFLDPDSGDTIASLKPIPFVQSQVYREAGSQKFSMDAKSKTALPVAFLDEIVKRQIRDPEMCAIDASLTSKSPSFDARADDLEPPVDGARSVQYLSLLVRMRFKSIFEQQMTVTRWIWVVYGKGTEGMQFWYPSKRKWSGLVCVS